jgi:hypothetical protein
MANKITVNLNMSQKLWLQRVLNALEAYNEKLKDAYLNGHVSYEIRNAADLFFTEKAVKSFYETGSLWWNEVEAIGKECASLDRICEDDLWEVRSQLLELHNAVSVKEGNPLPAGLIG